MKNFVNPFRLNNKLVFILGGAGLIGSNVSALLSNLGAKVIVIDNKFNSSIKYKKNIIFEKFNLSKIDKIKNYFEKIVKKYGVPNVFINCSYPKTKDWEKNNFERVKIPSYRKNIEAHLNSYVWSSKIMCDLMKKNKIHGSIILLNSIYGLVGQSPELYKGSRIKENMTYSIIKGGLINFTKQLAVFYGRNNIRVNSICSGGILDKQNSIFKKNYINKTLLKRMGNPQDISGAVAYLASESSSYVTGTNLIVDGGWTAI